MSNVVFFHKLDHRTNVEYGNFRDRLQNFYSFFMCC